MDERDPHWTVPEEPSSRRPGWVPPPPHQDSQPGEIPRFRPRDEPPGDVRSPARDPQTDETWYAAGASETTATVQPAPVIARRRRQRRRRLPVIVAGTAALALAAGSGIYVLVGSSEDKSPAAGSSRGTSQDSAYEKTVKDLNRQLDALLARRDSGIDNKDPNAFLAGLDPADKDLASGQKVTYKNLTMLPVVKHDFELARTSMPVPKDEKDLAGEWGLGYAYVTERVQLRNIDKRASEATYAWQLAVEDSKLIITDISPRLDPGSYAPAPWDDAALTLTQTEHMLVAATPDAAGKARQVADAAEAAYSRSTQYWRKGHPSEFVIFATAKPTTFRRWYGPDDEIGEDRAVAKTLAVPSCCARSRILLGDVTTTRIALDTSKHRQRVEFEWTLAHELTHAVAQPAKRAKGAKYIWADEGYAEWVGVQMLESRGYIANWASVARKAAQRSSFSGKLPTDRSFYGKNAELNYALAEQFFEYLVDRFGTAKTRDFYFYLNAMKVPDAGTAMRKYFKVSEQRLLAAWAESVA